MKKIYLLVAILVGISCELFALEMKKKKQNLMMVHSKEKREKSCKDQCCKYSCMTGCSLGYFSLGYGVRYALGSIPESCDICFGCCQWTGTSFYIGWLSLAATESMVGGILLGKLTYDTVYKTKKD